MSIRHFKSSITNIPTYLDGYFDCYLLKDDNGTFPKPKLFLDVLRVPFEQLSISDRLRIESDQHEIKLTYKLRIDGHPNLTSKHYLKINDTFHKVYNVFQFTNKDGFRQTDITLQEVKKELIINDQ